MEREGTNRLPYNHPACLGGAAISKCDLTKERLDQANTNLRYKDGKGKYAGHAKGGDHQSLVEKQKYKDHAETGEGLAGHNAGKEKNIDKLIQKASRTISFVEMFQNEKGEKIGFDLKPNVDGLPRKVAYDLFAKYCYTKDFRTFTQYVAKGDTKGLWGMTSYRLLENGEAVYAGRGNHGKKYANAGYRFLFNEGNNTRFS